MSNSQAQHSAKITTHLKHHTLNDGIHKLPPKMPDSLRILHTGDWHLGKLLHDAPRYDEFSQLLDWLLQTMVSAHVDVLIIAGDVFDTMTPSNRAEHLYHEFLASAYKQGVAHIIIVAGNHDSPTSLNKTRDVLGVLGVHVTGTPTLPQDAVLTLKDNSGEPIAIILTVPYLRDRDVRTSGDAQSQDDKTDQLLSGVADYYHQATQHAKNTQAALKAQHDKYIPLIATGHLFVAGASVSSEDDGMRDLQVGTLGQISAAIFSDAIDYVALGHIHAAQKVAGLNHIRYAGSPIAMGFGEVGRDKQMLIVDFPAATVDAQAPHRASQAVSNQAASSQAPSANSATLDLFADMLSTSQDKPAPSDIKSSTATQRPTPVVHSLPVPIFQSLARISGDMPAIKEALKMLDDKYADDCIWLEVEYSDTEIIANLRQSISELLDDSPHQLLSIKNKRRYQGSLGQCDSIAPLDSFDATDIFSARLNKEDISDAEKSALRTAYAELLKTLQETDHRAE